MSSIFTEEWRECLRAHYTYVVRMGDQGTERTLHGVMLEAGFGEDEVRQIYVLATAHVDDVGADFVPNMEIFAEEAPVMVAMPQEIIAAMVVEESLEADERADLEAEAALGSDVIADLEADAPLDSNEIDGLEVETTAELEGEPAAEDSEDDDAADEGDEPPKDDPGIVQLSLF